MKKILEHACKDFRCAQKEYCISPDLLCDQVNHCSDGSDEGVAANCKSKVSCVSLVIKIILKKK